LERCGLPVGEEKSRMFDSAEALLRTADYRRVGMDHFVRPDDELYQALLDGRLHRNFQGYCTRRTTSQVYAFGVTGISQLSGAYAQNTKDIPEYLDTIADGRLAIRRGYALSPAEQLVREVIESLMCNYRIDWDDLAARLHVTPALLKQATAYDETRLAKLAADGLIITDEHRLCVTPEGTPFVRNVAAALDPLMAHTDKTFSKPI
ncbi:MAG: coproporphyrinogen III oxidase, partial [Prevotellaceae bacterium]|nr:coproporphyrinogen III oxidase [Prevotellaceae bacterium]